MNYLWDVNAGLPILAIERNGNNALLRRYAYGVDLVAESTTASNAFYYLGDPLGSTANLVNSTGVTQRTYTYEPYGAVRSSSNASGAPINLMRFNGQLIDTVDNLYDLRARMYDPGTGRFLQLDPEQPPPLAPTAGQYVYAWARPTTLVDPEGRAAQQGGLGICGGVSCWSVANEILLDPAGSLHDGVSQVDWAGFLLKLTQCEYGGAQWAIATAPVGVLTGPGAPLVEAGSFLLGCGVSLLTPVEYQTP